eukprot:364341-Chlamydomonas_euryale.AAC.19
MQDIVPSGEGGGGKERWGACVGGRRSPAAPATLTSAAAAAFSSWHHFVAPPVFPSSARKRPLPNGMALLSARRMSASWPPMLRPCPMMALDTRTKSEYLGEIERAGGAVGQGRGMDRPCMYWCGAARGAAPHGAALQDIASYGMAWGRMQHAVASHSTVWPVPHNLDEA